MFFIFYPSNKFRQTRERAASKLSRGYLAARKLVCSDDTRLETIKLKDASPRTSFIARDTRSFAYSGIARNTRTGLSLQPAIRRFRFALATRSKKGTRLVRRSGHLRQISKVRCPDTSDKGDRTIDCGQYVRSDVLLILAHAKSGNRTLNRYSRHLDCSLDGFSI